MKRIVFWILCINLLVASLGAENVNAVRPKAGFTFDEARGTFGVYTIDSTGKRIPVFEENSDVTAFYLMADSKVYRLRKEAGITAQAQKTTDGGIITYTIASLAEVAVEFTFLTAMVGRPADMIRVEVRAANISGKEQQFSLKGRFDNTLGEKDGSFFSAEGQNKIASESQISSLSSAKWIKAADNDNTLRFLLYGEGITTPQSVTLANRDGMSPTVWDAKYTQGSGLSNTAVDIDWGQAQLPAGQTAGVLFYISLGSGLPPVPKAPVSQIALVSPGPPVAAVAVAPVTQPTEERMVEPTERLVAKAASIKSGAGAYVYPPTPTHDVPSYPLTAYPPAAYPQPVYPPAAYPPVYQYAQPFYPEEPVYPTQPVVPDKPVIEDSKSPIDLAYAKDLYDRIQKLASEKGGLNGKNREEIIRLNGELDGFLARIGQN